MRVVCGVLGSVATRTLNRCREAISGSTFTLIIPDEHPEMLCFLWRTRLPFPQPVAFVHRKGGGGVHSSVCLGDFDGSSITPHLCSRRFQICSLWTALVEHADMHSAVFLTPGAFYSGVSGLLRDSDSWSPRRSRLYVYAGIDS